MVYSFSKLKLERRQIMDRMTRRRFLGRAARTGVAAPFVGGLILTSRGKARAAVSPNEKILVGLVGSGGMGRGDLATFFKYPEVDCPIICDVDDAMIAKGVDVVKEHRDHPPDTVKDFRRLIERKDVDVVLVATPDHWHALPTVYACQAGKDVYVEKPLATSVAEGRAMLEAARRHNRVVQMGTQWRSGEHYQEAIEMVRSGKLGTIRMIRAWAYLDWVGGIGNPPDGEPPEGVDYDMWLGPAPKRPFNPNRFHFNFRWFWDYAGGLMTDWGVHLINLAMWAMGRQHPTSVSSSGGKFIVNDNTETPDTQITVYDGETIVMGGTIRDDTTVTDDRIPRLYTSLGTPDARRRRDWRPAARHLIQRRRWYPHIGLEWLGNYS